VISIRESRAVQLGCDDFDDLSKLEDLCLRDANNDAICV
jgi:hypothetical protein